MAQQTNERGFIAFTAESFEYYQCMECGSAVIPVFHWEGDLYFEFHQMFMKNLEILETGEAYLG